MLRALLLAGLTLLPGTASAGKTPASGPVHVSGYTRKDGTYVAPYYRRAPGTATPTLTSPVIRTYSSCAEARAAGRWNILRTDPDYSPSLDRDSDGIACEAGSDGNSIGTDLAPVGTTVTPYQPTPWNLIGMTYPDWLAYTLGWRASDPGCQALALTREQAFLNDGTGQSPAWRGTSGYLADLGMDAVERSIDPINTLNGMEALSPWGSSGTHPVRTVWRTGETDMTYMIELLPVTAARATICISTYVPR